MKLNNLLLHCGGATIDRQELATVRTPAPEGRWHPIAHDTLVDQVHRGLAASGMEVIGEAHALNRGGAHYFGLMQVAIDGREGDEWGTIVGLRNSHDKRFPAGLAMGACLFVCDNMAFNGQVVLARKHTTNIMRDLPGVTARAVGKLREFSGVTARRAAAYKDRELGNREAHDLVIRALDARAITTLMVPKVLDQWRAPNHPEFGDRNLWSLYNAFTETLKGGLLQLPMRSEALHGVLDSAAGEPVATLALAS
ncbi:MAG: DUF932 domain-containing protein [Verrucomicrobiales bacterium]